MYYEVIFLLEMCMQILHVSTCYVCNYVAYMTQICKHMLTDVRININVICFSPRTGNVSVCNLEEFLYCQNLQGKT